MAAGRLRPARPDVAVCLPASAASSPRDAAQPGEAFRHPVQRGAGDHQQAEPADQREQRGRDPGGDRRDQRGRGEEADEAAGGLIAPAPSAGDGVPCAMCTRPSAPTISARPADDDPPGLRVPVRVPQVTPGEQGEQDRQQPGHRAEPAADHVGHQPAGDIVHDATRWWPRRPRPRRGRRGRRRPCGASGPGRRRCGPGPARRSRPRARPASTGRRWPGQATRTGSGTRCWTAAGAAGARPAALVRRRGCAPSAACPCPGRRPGVAAGPGARRGARGPWPGGRTALRACAALRHTALRPTSLGDTGRHDDHGNQYSRIRAKDTPRVSRSA